MTDGTDGNFEDSWIPFFAEHQLALRLCGVAFTQIATGAFLYIHYSLVGKYADHCPAWAIYENIINHHADLQNVGCIAFYIGCDMIVLSLLPQLSDPTHAMFFFAGVLCICCFVAIGFGHVTPHVCRAIQGLRAVEATEFLAVSIYVDFTVPISEICFKALAQISCFIVYIFGLYHTLVSYSDKISLTYWAISIVAVQFYLFNADPQTSRHCYISSAHWVEALLSHMRGYTCFVKFGEKEWCRPSRPTLLLRVFLHFLLNGLGFLLIWLTVPVLVSVVDSPLDYIMNLFAVTFLHQLDDVDEVKKFIMRFDIVHFNDPDEAYASVTGARALRAESFENIPHTVSSMSVGGSGTTHMEAISRIAALEHENIDLKRRLAVLEAKINS